MGKAEPVRLLGHVGYKFFAAGQRNLSHGGGPFARDTKEEGTLRPPDTCSAYAEAQLLGEAPPPVGVHVDLRGGVHGAGTREGNKGGHALGGGRRRALQ